MNVKVNAVVKSIGTPQTFGEYTKVEVIADVKGQYPQTLLLEFGGKNLDKGKALEVGSEYEFDFGIRGKQVKDKVYMSLSCFGAKKTSQSDW